MQNIIVIVGGVICVYLAILAIKQAINKHKLA